MNEQPVERLSIFPEEKDRSFSKKLWQDWQDVMSTVRNGHEMAIEIAEKYDDEESPHYHIFWVDSDFAEHFKEFYPEDMELSICYRATANGESHNGTVKMRVFTNLDNNMNILLLDKLFDIYNRYILEYYPEWKTDYDNTSKICCEISKSRTALPEEGGTITFTFVK